MNAVYALLDNLEKYLCQALLAVFVCLLFAQILSRELFGYSIAWSEELSVYLFVWFAYFGASYATRCSAHNRVTFQYKLLPEKFVTFLLLLSDFLWLAFSSYFAYLSYDFVFNKMIKFWKSQTLGIPMQYIYLILPLAFALMSLRIIQVNYLKFFKRQVILDPEDQAMQALIKEDVSSQDSAKS